MIIFYVYVTITTEFASASRNLALKKPAWQSSNYSHNGLAHEAVDGDPSNNFLKDYSCTHTQGDPIPWWTVDLQGEYLVTEVVITNRGDCCGNASDNLITCVIGTIFLFVFFKLWPMNFSHTGNSRGDGVKSLKIVTTSFFW